RMFTSRAEFRLKLRADNADQRLTPLGVRLGCVGGRRQDAYQAKAKSLEDGLIMLTHLSLTPNEAARHRLTVNRDRRPPTAFDLLALPEITIDRLAQIWPEIKSINSQVATQLEVDARYAAYLDRQDQDVAALKRDEAIAIPLDFDFADIKPLSAEVRQKLER